MTPSLVSESAEEVGDRCEEEHLDFADIKVRAVGEFVTREQISEPRLFGRHVLGQDAISYLRPSCHCPGGSYGDLHATNHGARLRRKAVAHQGLGRRVL